MILYLAMSLALQAKANRVVNEKLRQSVVLDGLTGLFNRYAYEEDLSKMNANPEQMREDLNYIVFDVNGLKNINDNLGHEAGNELIKAAARCISDCFGKYGKVYRTGGDEFIAMINASEEHFL